MGAVNPRGLRLLWYRLLRGTGEIAFRTLYRLRIEGAENIPKEGPVLLASNHQSFLDPVLLGVICPRPVVFTPRATLDRSWVYRALTRWAPIVRIDRDQSQVAATRILLGLLAENAVIALFPEQTRTSDGKLGAVRPGFQLLSDRGGAPVVPVAIHGAFEIWPRSRRLPRLRGRLRVFIGPPLERAVDRRDSSRALEDAWKSLGLESREPTGASGDAASGVQEGESKARR